MVVSHNSEFLQKLCTSFWSLERGRLSILDRHGGDKTGRVKSKLREQRAKQEEQLARECNAVKTVLEVKPENVGHVMSRTMVMEIFQHFLNFTLPSDAIQLAAEMFMMLAQERSPARGEDWLAAVLEAVLHVGSYMLHEELGLGRNVADPGRTSEVDADEGCGQWGRLRRPFGGYLGLRPSSLAISRQSLVLWRMLLIAGSTLHPRRWMLTAGSATCLHTAWAARWHEQSRKIPQIHFSSRCFTGHPRSVLLPSSGMGLSPQSMGCLDRASIAPVTYERPAGMEALCCGWRFPWAGSSPSTTEATRCRPLGKPQREDPSMQHGFHRAVGWFLPVWRRTVSGRHPRLRCLAV